MSRCIEAKTSIHTSIMPQEKLLRDKKFIHLFFRSYHVNFFLLYIFLAPLFHFYIIFTLIYFIEDEMGNYFFIQPD